MPKYANLSVDATAMLRQKTGNSLLECYSFIDPEDSEKSFFTVRYTNKVVYVAFQEIQYDKSSFVSLVEGLYKVLNE